MSFNVQSLGDAMVANLIQSRDPMMSKVMQSLENSNTLDLIQVDEAKLAFADKLEARITKAISDGVDGQVIAALQSKYKKYMA